MNVYRTKRSSLGKVMHLYIITTAAYGPHTLSIVLRLYGLTRYQQPKTKGLDTPNSIFHLSRRQRIRRYSLMSFDVGISRPCCYTPEWNVQLASFEPMEIPQICCTMETPASNNAAIYIQMPVVKNCANQKARNPLDSISMSLMNIQRQRRVCHRLRRIG